MELVDVVGQKMHRRSFVSAIDDYAYNSYTERVAICSLFYERLGWTDVEGKVIRRGARIHLHTPASTARQATDGAPSASLSPGNSFGDATMAEMKAACEGEGRRDQSELTGRRRSEDERRASCPATYSYVRTATCMVSE